VRQDGMELGRYGPLVRIEVDIARRHGETVGLAHDRRRNDGDRKIQIPHKPLYDEQLLIVFLTEYRDVGQALQEQLGDDRRHTGKKVRTRYALERLRNPRNLDTRREIVRIDIVYVGC